VIKTRRSLHSPQNRLARNGLACSEKGEAMAAEHTPPGGLGRRLLAAAQQDTSWLVRIGGDTERRLTTAEVVDAYNDQSIEPDTYVWTEGMATWEQLQAVDALVDALHAEAERYQGGSGPSDEPGSAAPAESGDARSEDSLVFSLSTLVQDRPAQESPARARDDSGLIDLAALSASAATAPAGEATATPPQDMLFGGGLFTEAKAKSVAPPASPALPAPARQRGLIIGLSAAAALMAALLVFQIVRTHGAAESSAANGVASATAAPQSTGEERAPEPAPSAVVAAPTSAPSADPADSAVVVADNQRPGKGQLPPPRPTGRGTSRPPADPPPAKTAPPKTGACPCDANDLMCQMRCAAKP